MLDNKIRVYHFHNASGGGVLSVIKNLIESSRDSRIENHIIFTRRKEKELNFIIPNIRGAISVQIFNYSTKWNFWYTCRRLGELIPDDKCVLVAHDWLELGMVSHLGLQNPLVQMLHGDYQYYYQLAMKHQRSIDIFACVSPVITKNIKRYLPDRMKDIYYCPFPVPRINCFRKKDISKLRLTFCARNLNDESKQFQLLPRINQILRQKKVSVQWSIIGKGKTEFEMKKLLGETTRYFSFLKNEEVQSEMCRNDVLIHPSLVEGFPVVVVEGMKAGLVPLITNWNGGTAELVIEGETGFYFKPRDANEYAKRIIYLHQHPEILNQISKKAREKAKTLFDPFNNTKVIENVYELAYRRKKVKKVEQVYGSRLDRRWIPNILTFFIRKILY